MWAAPLCIVLTLTAPRENRDVLQIQGKNSRTKEIKYKGERYRYSQDIMKGVASEDMIKISN